MSLGKYIVEKHSKIVAVVFPAGVAFGCGYTMKNGTNPFTDLKSWATGTEAPQGAYSYQFKLGSAGTK